MVSQPDTTFSPYPLSPKRQSLDPPCWIVTTHQRRAWCQSAEKLEYFFTLPNADK